MQSFFEGQSKSNETFSIALVFLASELEFYDDYGVVITFTKNLVYFQITVGVTVI